MATSSNVYCFSVHAEASPSALPRVVEVFALHGHVPSRCHARLDGADGETSRWPASPRRTRR
jgi:hypothetical protein